MNQTNEPYDKKVIYIPVEDTYKDPAVDLLKLLKIFSNGKYFILSFCLVCTIGAALICSFFIQPAYKASATVAMAQEAIGNIAPYLRSSDFKQKLVAKSDAARHLRKKMAGYLSNEEKFPFSFSTVRSRQEFLDLYWVDGDPAVAAEMLENAIVAIEQYYQNNLRSRDQLQMSFLRSEIDDLKAKVDKIWQNYGENGKIALPDFELIQRYFKLMDRKHGLEINDALATKFKVVQKPMPPVNPFKPDTKLIVILTFLFSLLTSIVCTLIYNSLKKNR